MVFFFIFIYFFIFIFFCRLGLKCFIYREMVNIKDHKLSEIFLTVGLAEPIKCVLTSVIYIFSDSLRHVKFSFISFQKKIVRFSKQS